ncbi:hypothetical protein ACWJKU_04400 [Methylocaldum sp. MU1018]
MGRYDRSWYRDEIRKNGSARQKTNRNSLGRYGAWFLAILSPFAVYHLNPGFQSRIDALWANAKEMFFMEARGQAVPRNPSRRTDPGSASPRPATPPSYPKPPDGDSQTNEKKKKNYAIAGDPDIALIRRC